MLPEDDRELMLQVTRGSRGAFAELVSRYEGRLIAYFYRQCADREFSEDCAQEVFVRLYRGRDRYGPSAKFTTFLFTIARNYWIDVTRARRVRPTEASLSGRDDRREEEVLAPQPGPLEEAKRVESAALLHHALQELPEGQRQAILLGVIQGLPYAEVSRILEVPIGTVKSRVHAGVLALRERLHNPPSPRDSRVKTP